MGFREIEMLSKDLVDDMIKWRENLEEIYLALRHYYEQPQKEVQMVNDMLLDLSNYLED